MIAPYCPECGCVDVEYHGVDDGFDEGVCDVWECCQCGCEFTDGCIDYDDGDIDDDDYEN